MTGTTELDQLSINTIRTPSIDAVQAANIARRAEPAIVVGEQEILGNFWSKGHSGLQPRRAT